MKRDSDKKKKKDKEEKKSSLRGSAAHGTPVASPRAADRVGPVPRGTTHHDGSPVYVGDIPPPVRRAATCRRPLTRSDAAKVPEQVRRPA